jgi:hypothetical protein
MIEVRQDSDGSVDEVLSMISCANVHLESLGDGNWYLRVTVHGDQPHELTVSITPKRAFIYEARNVEIVCTDARSASPIAKEQQT